jgi:hypothetical protein
MARRVQQMPQSVWRWNECQERTYQWQSEEPQTPRLGQGFQDPRTNCVYVWNGSEWVCVPAD